MNKNRILAEAFPPGDFIKEEMEERGWNQTTLAEIIGRPLQVVNQLIKNKKSITVRTAQELAAAFGTSSEFWLNLQNQYQLYSEQIEQEEIKLRAKLFDRGPIKEIVKRGWIEQPEDFEQFKSNVNRFYETQSIHDEPQIVAAARKSTSYYETTPPQKAWLFRAKHLASKTSSNRFSVKAFEKRLGDLRALAANAQDAQEIPKILRDIGIRFVIVEKLKSSKIDGAAFWLDDNSPVIALSLRYDRIDGFWYSLGHELGHIYHGHGKDDAFLPDVEMVAGPKKLNNEEKPEIELVADKFAAELLIDQSRIESFIERKAPFISKENLNQFANLIGVHPGIIVGQLHHRDAVPFSHFRKMLVPVREFIVNVAMTDGWGNAPNIK
jgi:HTH-type transcriptional regulator/antitoxin HigA